MSASDWYYRVRYSRLFPYALTVLVIGGIVYGVANTLGIGASGWGVLTTRMEHAVNAGRWYARALQNSGGRAYIAPTETLYGWVEGVAADGAIVGRVYKGDKVLIGSWKIGDVRIHRDGVPSIAKKVAEFKGDEARFDVYDDAAVVWLREDDALNLILIEKGLAEAENSPPTNIVDKVFAAYYWRKAQGK